MFVYHIIQQRLSLVVKTDGSHSLEENMRQTLLACYMEFSDILQQMAITHVSISYIVVITYVFTTPCSLGVS